MGFFDRLESAVSGSGSLVCVGLDPRPEYLAAEDVFAFNRRIIEATADLVSAYKPNFGFYEALGLPGLIALRQTITYIHDSTDVLVILDAKRGDIGSTAEAYAHGAFDVWGADAVTLNPYLGSDSVSPFLRYGDRGAFVLCHTSNPGAEDFQEVSVGCRALYEVVAHHATKWDDGDSLGLVVGATYVDELATVRSIAPDMWVLLPGIGAQGGDLSAALMAGLRADGSGLLISVSRSIACSLDPRSATLALRDEINRLRQGTARAGVQPDVRHQQLAQALGQLGCIQFGQFTLASGQTSPFYLDLRLLVTDPPTLRLVARAYARVLRRLQFDRLAAIPYAGLPIGTAVALETDRPLIYPRKEVKEHGSRRAIEGKFRAGEQVVVLDDVISSGGSKLSAIRTLEAAGLLVRDVVVLLDREQGGREELAEQGYQLHSVLSLSELMALLHRTGHTMADQAQSHQDVLDAASPLSGTGR
jgi:uridine monophosphate synthetase